jgi:predicted AAA+ superfamily ATPase
MSSPAGSFSVHKIHDDLRSQGLNVGKDSLYAWLDHIQDAYVFFAIPIHARSERARQVNPRKVYAVDPGLVTACARRGTADLGQLLETAVFGELRRRTAEIAYVRTASGYEVDFLVESELIQVCASLADSATRDREFRAVREAMSELGIAKATVVTVEDDESVPPIRVIPFWRWALGG